HMLRHRRGNKRNTPLPGRYLNQKSKSQCTSPRISILPGGAAGAWVSLFLPEGAAVQRLGAGWHWHGRSRARA
ncbi:hypothetical protein, partial [Poseidonocella sp. HB161398]|uniref:hypothetical protein n=1 Tax=Poseidonocella sp. HB161398 TaxID=2320855 RepID=UPI00197D9A91